MTKAEFKARLAAIGWAQKDFAAHFGLSANTVSRWGLAGQVECFPPWVDPALRLLEGCAQTASTQPRS